MNPFNHLPLAGLVLAAGASRRMGTAKAAMRIGGVTFLARVLDGLDAAELAPIVIVAGVHREAVSAALPVGSRARVVVNPEPDRGQLASLKVGLRELVTTAPEVAGVVVALVDHASVAGATVAALARAARTEGPPIIVPVHAGRRGHPIVFMRPVWAELLDTPDSESARVVVRRDAAHVREEPVDDSGVLRDFDTPEEVLLYERHHPGA